MDHPRLRGTNTFTHSLKPLTVGSPPLARDKYMNQYPTTNIFGITPACAGQMFDINLLLAVAQDHPRLRGTNLCQRGIALAVLGSPPLARDKFLNVFVDIVLLRITPACAGQILKDLIILSHLSQLFAKSI